LTTHNAEQRTSEGVVRTNENRLNLADPNARKYLISIMIYGAGFGIHRILFNFFLRSLGFDETIMRLLSTVSSLTVLISALPMGYLADRLGRKFSLIMAALVTGASILLMVIFPTAAILIITNILMGLGSSLGGVVSGPFLMENSGEQERTYLFSISSGFHMVANSIGNWIGGYMPTWFGSWLGVSATNAKAYAWSMGIIVIVVVLALIPFSSLSNKRLPTSERSVFAPISFIKKHPKALGKLILPMLITSLGAGLIMPFMNVFFRTVHHQSDSAIGLMFALGSLAMAVGLILAPPLADRVGKIQLVVISQALSIPFLYILGFSSWFPLVTAAYYIRVGLMNMSGPVYQTYVLEKVKPEARATIASLISMANSFGWALSPTISGMLQVRYGFGPSFTGTIVLYCLSTFLYWWYFWKAFKPKSQAEQLPG